MSNDSNMMIGLLFFGLIVYIGLFFLFRFVVLWYFRINTRADAAVQQTKHLAEISATLKAIQVTLAQQQPRTP